MRIKSSYLVELVTEHQDTDQIERVQEEVDGDLCGRLMTMPIPDNSDEFSITRRKDLVVIPKKAATELALTIVSIGLLSRLVDHIQEQRHTGIKILTDRADDVNLALQEILNTVQD